MGFVELLFDFDEDLSLASVVSRSLRHGDSHLDVAVVTHAGEGSETRVVRLDIVTGQISAQTEVPIELVVQVAGDLFFTYVTDSCNFIVELVDG